MVSMWFSVAWVLLPVAIALLVIMMIPLPSFLDSLVMRVVNLCFEVKIPVIDLNFFFTVLVGSGCLCAMQLQSLLSADKDKGHVIEKKCIRWRKERNFWISTTTFIIYFMLWRYHALKTKLRKAKDAKGK